ncbi:hypothetical protein JRQ81_009640 [Phrynocephalus forsythii]|uniref:Uncharacterized protein n=1 Tax=Phrynocephalus forsythii TaxID=171643 RepID=A0A9Q0XC19_9SAUR|nr:hypothetical protein JRQ81_009640 [Phrynocephalus forsythii]
MLLLVKETARRDSRDTPLRRSSRLQQEKAETQQVSRELQNLKGSRSDDVLRPRESIRAHRRQADFVQDDPQIHSEVLCRRWNQKPGKRTEKAPGRATAHCPRLSS